MSPDKSKAPFDSSYEVCRKATLAQPPHFIER